MPITYPTPEGRPLVLGHRGASAHAGDNTVEALRHAVAHGADGVEIDVRFTADGAVVLSHNPSEPGYGVFAERTFEDLRRRLPHVPTLDEGAALLGDLIINVEIKNNPAEPDFDPTHRMADVIVAWIEEGTRHERCVVTSFNPDTVARVRQLDERVTTGQIAHRNADLARVIPEAAEAGHSYVAAHRRLLRAKAAKTVAFAASHDLEIVAWTVDKARTLSRLRKAGVAAVITNDPRAALHLYAAAS